MNESTDPWSTLRVWFPDLEEDAWSKLQEYCDLLREWNTKINLVSRKDTDRLEIKHLAHCLTITKFLRLMPKARLLDVGTGGGLPGIPLSICYPQARFTLMDSIGKKSWWSRIWSKDSVLTMLKYDESELKNCLKKNL